MHKPLAWLRHRLHTLISGCSAAIYRVLPHVYEIREPRTDFLLQTAVPDIGFLEALGEILKQESVASDDVAQTFKNKALAPVETLELPALLERMRHVLQTNYNEMRRFTEEELAVSFDYVVYREDAAPSIIRLMTRMYDPNRKGSVSYGREIVKIGSDRYYLCVYD